MSVPGPGREPKKNLHEANIANKKSTLNGFFINTSIKNITVKVPNYILWVFLGSGHRIPF